MLMKNYKIAETKTVIDVKPISSINLRIFKQFEWNLLFRKIKEVIIKRKKTW